MNVLGKIDYKKIYDLNQDEWKALTREPQKYEALLAGHYSDSNHFVYELLQNAEDEKASKVIIEYYKDRLVFYHNGSPFDEADVKGVSSMLMGTKDREDAQTIGRFGMGFKSVFKYTHQPQIYSDEEAFCIKNYLLPVELKDGWDYISEKETVSCKLGIGKTSFPFRKEDHLTKIIIPFSKRKDDGSIETISGQDVIKKLEELGGEILLFLTYIKELYWIDTTKDKYALITLDASSDDKNLVTCRIEGSKVGNKEEINRYLRFMKTFDHKDMKNANVGIAYRVNNRANNVNEMKDNCISVYFPTKDETKLPFLVHGSFETAVSREKLMEPSAFNNDLYDELGNLICESLEELADRQLITQTFIRRILIPAFAEERIEGLKEKITDQFKTKCLIPDINNEYLSVSDLSLAIPFGISDFFESPLFSSSFNSVLSFVALSDEKGAGFTDYFSWLKGDVGVQVFSLDTWAQKLQLLEKNHLVANSNEREDLMKLYAFLSDYRESLYEKNVGYSTYRSNYSRSGPYETALKNMLSSAWNTLRTAPIVLNAERRLVSAYIDNNEQIYLSASSKYKKVVSSAIVDVKVAEEYKQLLEEGLQINEFDNYQYVKEKVIKKYVEIHGDINFDSPDDDYEDEYVEDLKQIIQLFDDGHNSEEIRSLLKKAYIIRIKKDNGDVLFNIPADTYLPVSDEDVNLKVYFQDVNETDELIDEEFYNQHGISLAKLKLFGLYTFILNEGDTYYSGSPGNPYWRALNGYCPKIDIDYWDENIEYIEENPDEELAKKKSGIMLNFLLTNYHKLAGEVEHNRTNRHVLEEESYFLKYSVRSSAWIYNVNEELCRIRDISRFELNTDIYGILAYNKDAYQLLGFIQKEQDVRAEAYDVVDTLEDHEQKLLLKQLARKFGYSLEQSNDEPEDTNGESGVFTPEDWISKDFPERRMKNHDSLMEHVRQQFFCADPIKYQQVLRQIRTSKNSKTVREYAIGMYTNADGVRICQMCREPIQSVEVTEIANFGIEMEQLNLCLCRNCAAKYKMLRDNNKTMFKEAIRDDLCDIYISDDMEEYDEDDFFVELTGEESLYFTQTHVAEIQEIFDLVDRYGIPDEKEKVDIGTATGPLQHPARLEMDVKTDAEEPQVEAEEDVVHDGSFITYKKLFSGENYDNTVQSTKYPLHKAFLGKQIGDIISFQGKEYEITSIL